MDNADETPQEVSSLDDPVMSRRMQDEMTREVPSSDDEGIPDHLDPLPSKRSAGDGHEGVMPPGDRPAAALSYGTTEREQREGEPLSYRLAQEEPDVTDLGGWGDGAPVGRLVEPESEVDELDVEGDAIGTEQPDDIFGRSAEEAALHIEEAP